jgi:hypothetical protein
MENDKYGVSHTYIGTLEEISMEFEGDMLAAGFGEVHVYPNTRSGAQVLVDDADEIVMEEIVEVAKAR